MHDMIYDDITRLYVVSTRLRVRVSPPHPGVILFGNHCTTYVLSFSVGAVAPSCAQSDMHLPTLFLDNLLHNTKPSKRDPPTHTRRRYVADAAAVLINITLATATLAAGTALADVNRVGRRAPREQRLYMYHVCV